VSSLHSDQRQGRDSHRPERVSAPLRGELRYGLELARLLADGLFRRVTREPGRLLVLLIPGFMAGDASLTVLAGWLRRRGHAVKGSGILVNADCAGRELARLQGRLGEFDGSVVLIGQSRGGTLARALAACDPEAVAALVTLGAPVLDPLAVSPSVIRTVSSLARLGDLGLPGVFSSDCRDGACCAEFRAALEAPLPPSMPTLAVYCVAIDGSHCGMAVNADVYRELERLLDRTEAAACSR
jgi:pimeloyl-ACP methyl ester carboxylesterase